MSIASKKAYMKTKSVQMAELLSKHAREGALKVDRGLLCLHRGPGSHLQGCC